MAKNTFPRDAYVAVRYRPEGWVAVVARRGAVLQCSDPLSRAEAFDIARRKAEYEGLPALVGGVSNG